MDLKPAQVAADLDAARCRGDWATIPELARRYKRHHPDETVLDAAACIEAELVEQIRPTPSSEYANDTPDSIYLSASLGSSQGQPFIQRMQDIIRGKSDNLELADDRQAQFAKILLGRIYYEMGDYDKALESLSNLALRIEDATSGYGLVLLIQARAIKGICFEQQDKIASAIEAYSTAWDVVEQHLKAKSDMLWDWMEECLYRGILLQLRSKSSPLRLMRAYLKLSNAYWRTNWRPHKRWVIFNLYALEADTSVDELIPVMDILRKLHKSFVTIDTTTELNQRTVELANLTSQVHDRVGWGDVRHIRRVLQFLYQAKEHTFNSACITRHLLFTLLRLGNFDEAKHTFASYMDLVGAIDIDNSDEPKHYEPITVLRRAAIVEETQEQLITVLLAGAYFHGHIYSNGKLATIIMHLAISLVEEIDQGSDMQELIARCYRLHGAACGVYARQCDDPDTRSEYHTKSIESLKKSIELQETWQSYYELSVEQAVTRNLYDATASISRSIQLNQTHLPSWHLLALIHSCQENKETQALQTLETGLQQSKLQEYSNITLAPVWSFTDEKTVALYATVAESHLAMAMTEVQLLEKLEGPEAVLDLYTDLFSMYAKLSTHLETDQEQEQPPMVEEKINGRQNSISSSRRASRSLSFSRRRSNSAGTRPTMENGSSNSDLPPISPSGQPRPPRRMKSSSSDETRSDRRGSDMLRTRSSSISRESKSLRKKSMQLIDMGFARRMGTSQTKQSSSGSTLLDERPTPTSEGSSATLMSLLTPSFSTASMNVPERRGSNTSTISAIITKPTHFYTRYQRDRWYHLLVKLWLMSTTTFIRAGRLEEATKAIVEAEQQLLAGRMNDASVWYQLGMVCIQKAKTTDQLYETGLDALKKALAIDPDHIDALVAMARCFIDLEEWEIAEGLLDRATHGFGWDHAPAWYWMGVCYRHQHHLEQAKHCFQYAVELSETTPLQPFALLPRFVQ
ncbi:hypothetical protein BJV82DRAFT_665280 [Fennellomyces sp. T-0311]|nr:hypothetical protein BJV82DRAFT_665280 [Fennellomyces sp. T-0311]